MILLVWILVDCNPVPQARLSCENYTLTVIWSTDVVYDATVTQIPVGMEQRVTKRLQKPYVYDSLKLVVINRQPPWVLLLKYSLQRWTSFATKLFHHKLEGCSTFWEKNALEQYSWRFILRWHLTSHHNF